MVILDKIVKNYFLFVFLWDEDENGKKWCEKTDDPTFNQYLESDFKFTAVDNWESGFDIVEWYEGTGDYAINGHYKSGRHGSIANLVDCKEKSPEMVFRDYACNYLYRLSLNNLREILLSQSL